MCLIYVHSYYLLQHCITAPVLFVLIVMVTMHSVMLELDYLPWTMLFVALSQYTRVCADVVVKLLFHLSVVARWLAIICTRSDMLLVTIHAFDNATAIHFLYL